jgi:hypothetical protein
MYQEDEHQPQECDSETWHASHHIGYFVIVAQVLPADILSLLAEPFPKSPKIPL